MEHAARLADVEEALLVVLLDPVIEALRVEQVADVLGQPAEVLDRVLLGVADPLLFVAELAQVLVQVFAKVTDDRGRLVADLARRQSFGHPRHRLELLADAEPVGGGVGCQPAGLSHPAAGRLTSEQVLTSLLCLVEDLTKVALQAVDDRRKALWIYKVEVS